MEKIIYLDADGTLFHHKGYVPASAFRAIEQAQANGHKIVLCTGRQLVEIYGDLKKIDYDAIIAGAGGTVLVKDKLLFDGHFSQAQIHRLAAYLNEHAIPAVYESRLGVFGDAMTKRAMKARCEQVCAGLDEKQARMHGMTLFYNSVEELDPKEIFAKPISKISFLETKKPYREIEADLRDEFDLIRATFAPLGPESGEIGCRGISKATGMDLVDRYFGVLASDTAAIGDGENDFCMFERAGVAIAMGNARPAVKEKADWVTADLEEDGILKAFAWLDLL